MTTNSTTRSLLVTPDGFTAIVGLDNGSLWLCNLISGDMTTIATSLPGAITALASTPDSHHILCGSEDGSVQLWNLETQKPDAAVLRLRGPIHQLSIGAKPNVAAALSANAIVIFDPSLSKLLGLPMNYDDLSCFALQPQGERVAVGLQSGRAQLRTMGNGGYVGVPLAHAGPVTAATFGSGGQVLVTGDSSGLLHVWRADTGAPAGAAQDMDGGVLFCQSTPRRELIVCVSDKGEVRLWNPLAGGLMSSNRTRKNVRAASISGDGTHVVMALRDEPAIQVWEVYARMIEPRYYSADEKTPEFVAHLHQPAPSGAKEGAVFCWNAARTQSAHLSEDSFVIIQPGGTSPVRVSSSVLRLALSDDGNWLATAHADRNVRLWNTATGKQKTPALLHNTTAQHLAFTPDSRTLVTGTEEGELRCWDTATREPMMPSVKRGEKIKALATTADGTRVLFQRESGGWFTLPVPLRPTFMPDWFLSLAEAIAHRRLNQDGTTETLSHDGVLKAVALIPRSPSPEEKHLAALARWLVANPARRTLWPEDPGEFSDYLTELVETKEPAALREVLRFDPLNETAAGLLHEPPAAGSQ